jgi:3-dehydroquinate synthase
VSSIFLIGFMGAGKTSVGQILARRMGLRLADCDALIQKLTGMTIGEIFAREREPGFRRIEAKVLREVAGGSGQVVAVGGGAPAHGDNMRLLRSSGTVVWLRASPQELWQRLRSVSDRPMLRPPTGGRASSASDRRARMEKLLAARIPYYSEAHVTVDVSGLTPAQAASRAREQIRKVRVELGERSYDILIDSGLLETFSSTIAKLRPITSAAVITHPKLDRLYGGAVREGLRELSIPAITLAVPPGERSKSFRQIQKLQACLVRAGLDRGSVIIALGGGVIGDLAGFAAATYMRGIRFVQVPTTLLAQVDASVGGKVAVNLPEAKNMVGSFHQPSLVLADLDTLRTLPRRHVRAGLAEVVKHGIVADEDLFRFVEQRAPELLGLDPLALQYVVGCSCRIKAQVVAADEREGGLRAILNFGHTVGHALESASGYRHLLHGEAISAGMVAASRLASRLGLFDSDQAERVEALLSRLGLPARASADCGELLTFMARDKKARAGRLRMILPRRIGCVTIVDDVPESELTRVLSKLS